MVIISRNNITDDNSFKRYKNAQILYAMVYVVITFVVLLFLNLYTAETSQELFYSNKETAMIERCQLAASDIGSLQVLNPDSVHSAVVQMQNIRYTRLVVTDEACKIIYDSANNGSKFAMFPEILRALEGLDVFTWNYADQSMRSCAATPIYASGRLLGCVYMTEYDAEQGALFFALRRNIFTVTFILELIVILFSILFAHRYTRRIQCLRSSMHIIRNGNYAHKVRIGGNDELTMLGAEFNELTERLNISETKRRQFVSDASHELKTPLASIKLLTDSILQNPVDMETVREFVGDIGAEAERLNRLSEKLLALSKVDQSEISDREIIYMQPTIQRVVKMLQKQATQNQVTITANTELDSPILTQSDDLYQIVFNLVENAIKYNVPGGNLHISLSREKDNAILRVADTGAGVPEDAIENIFERFYRVDKARSRKTGGSGLGLAIVRDLVLRHNGTITVDSIYGKGSTFTVVFPVFDVEVESK